MESKKVKKEKKKRMKVKSGQFFFDPSWHEFTGVEPSKEEAGYNKKKLNGERVI